MKHIKLFEDFLNEGRTIEKIEKDNHMVRDTEVLNKNQLESRQLRGNCMETSYNFANPPSNRTYYFFRMLLSR